MTEHNEGGDQQYLRAVGERFVKLASEWQEKDKRPDQNVHMKNFVTATYSALALGLAVRATEYVGQPNGIRSLENAESDLRSKLPIAAAEIKK